MNELQALRARRQLLVASAALQRLRLAYEWQGLRAAAQPARWATPALVATAAVLLWRTVGLRRGTPSPSPALQLGAAALALWRLLHAPSPPN